MKAPNRGLHGTPPRGAPPGAPAGRGGAGFRPPGGARRPRARFRAGLPAAVAVALSAAPAEAQEERPRLDEVIGRAAAYVAEYVDHLSNVVMEEDYRQTYYRDAGSMPSHSRLVSEFLLMRADEGGRWVGFRDVVELNGRRLQERGDRLASLFADGGADAVARARRISAESARYNLGATDRTFNVPTYSLLFLHPANVDRFRFERARTGRAGCAGAAAGWDVRFEEVVYPTMARGFQGISLPARGRFCFDPGSGRVIETEFALDHPAVRGERPATEAAARVTFGLEPRLDVWVPVEMRDSVSEDGGRRVVGTARYRNYRRFDVLVSENTDPPPGEGGGPR